MKYLASESTGTVVLFPNNDPTPQVDHVIRAATEADLAVIADNTKGLLRAVPNDPENHYGDWHLVRDEAVPQPVLVPKLNIIRALRDLGKEDQFYALLNAIPHAKTDWDAVTTINTLDPLFAANAAAIKSSLGLTDAQFAALLTP